MALTGMGVIVVETIVVRASLVVVVGKTYCNKNRKLMSTKAKQKILYTPERDK